MKFIPRTSKHFCIGLLFILTILATMTGCASQAKKACRQIDWQRMGYMDGSQGKLAESSSSQRDTCIKEGVTPDMAQYELGRRQGLEQFCTADNGLAVGTKGDPYQDVCPPALRSTFLNAYQKGLRAYVRQLEKDIRTKSELQITMRQALTGVEEDIAYLEKEISDAGVGQARLRMGMISEMEMLEADQQSLDLQISALGMDLEEMRQQLSRIKSSLDSLNQ